MEQTEYADLKKDCFQRLMSRDEYNRIMMKTENVLIGEISENEESFQSIGSIFLSTAEQYKDFIAVRSEEGEFTYDWVLKKVFKVRKILKDKEIKKNDRVCLMVSNTVDTVIFMLAIISIGASYVPIDIKYPEARRKFIETDCGAQIVFSKEERMEIINNNEDIILEEKFEDSVEDACYVIYTSGTTGMPKGVEIKQKYVLNLCRWFKDTFKLTANSRVLSLNSLCFDASVKNIFTTLLSGGCLVLNLESTLSPKKLLQYIKDNSVTHLNGTPSMINELLESGRECVYDYFNNLTALITGGERFSNNQNVKELYLKKNKKISICNVYGPTECTSITSFHMLTENEIMNQEKNIPVGIPILNKIVCIADKEGYILDGNTKGEIYIGGEGTAHKYINRDKLTKEKFIKIEGKYFYKSGDIGSIDKESRVLYCDGRIDSQIKLNGYRIELDEVARSIEKCTHVNKCECIFENNMIIAFYTSDTQDSEKKIKEMIENLLPEYMVPNYLIQIKEFDLTFNGKIDSEKLRFKFNELQNQKSDENLNAIQKKIACIWKKVLNSNKVMLNDNFFDVGGNSLKLFKLARYIERDFNIEMEPIQLMELSTIKKISEFIENRNDKTKEETDDINKFDMIRQRRSIRYSRIREKE